MKLIKKMFIKDYKNTSNSTVRFRYGLTAGIFGVISNLLLFLSKLLIGVLSGSITIIADAVNNLSDVGSSTIVLLGFKLSSKPADSEHPFGHQRYEQIMALIVAVIVLAIGVLLGKSSIEKIITPEKTTVTTLTYIILAIAVLVKLFQMFLYKDFAKAINSDVLKASSIDSRNDVISTLLVIVAMVLVGVIGDVGVSIDGIFGLAVSLFIVFSSVKLIKETISPLLGEMPDENIVKKWKNIIASYDGVLGVHDFLIHSYGVNNYYASAHVEVDANEDIMLVHDRVDNIERDFKEKFNIILSLHMDPIQTDNEEVNYNKKKVEVILKNLDPQLSFHDFRLVSGNTHTNIIFDVVIPFNCTTTLQQVKQELINKYKNEDKKYYFVIEVDRM